MDNHQLMLKISRLLPSSFTSCQFRNLGDVAESSIPITKLENDHSSLSLQKNPKICNKTLLSHRPPTKTDKLQQKRAAISLINHSSTSNGGCFTSSDDVETDTFFSLSSNSGDSFRLGTASRRFRRRDQMTSIDETGRRSFSSVASSDTKCSRRATATATAEAINGGGGGKESSRICSDQISTELYYHSNGGRNRRRMKKGGALIGDSYAVEKRSSDPHGDFRASMVEMIVEKRIFAAEDLERLLRCFLSLNSPSYHWIIFHVFSEICQTLFTN